MTEILTPISTDHSPVFFSLSKGKECLRGKGFWKFNNYLTKDQNHTTDIKKFIRSFFSTNESHFSCQIKWELLKYEVREFTINYTKQIVKQKWHHRANLDNQIKIFEKSLDEYDNLSKCNVIKDELDAIYHLITKGIRIRSKCNWYEK